MVKWTRPKVIIISCVFILAAPLTLLLVAKFWIETSASSTLYENLKSIPKNHFGLVLGTSPYVAKGRENLFFKYRMEAAKNLYDAGKVSALLVSGAKPSKHYDEPMQMKKALIKLGVPENKIHCDEAGFRTLDSIVRAKEVFQLDNFTIISQKFHNQRALFIAKHKGIDAIAYNAEDVPPPLSAKTLFREPFARVKTLIDLFVTNQQPRLMDQPVDLSSK